METSAFIVIVSTSVGAIVGAIITYFCSLKIAERNHRKIAGAKLRAAFAPEIAEYRSRKNFSSENTGNFEIYRVLNIIFGNEGLHLE